MNVLYKKNRLCSLKTILSTSLLSSLIAYSGLTYSSISDSGSFGINLTIHPKLKTNIANQIPLNNDIIIKSEANQHNVSLCVSSNSIPNYTVMPLGYSESGEFIVQADGENIDYDLLLTTDNKKPQPLLAGENSQPIIPLTYNQKCENNAATLTVKTETAFNENTKVKGALELTIRPE